MLPLQVAGLVLSGGLLLKKAPGSPLSGKRKLVYKVRPIKLNTRAKRRYRIRTRIKPVQLKPIDIGGFLNTLSRSLTTSISRAAKKIMGEDYSSILKEFIPQGANPVRPQYPPNAGRYLFADLDGDLKDELITSYRLDNELKTIVLKKEDERWYKIAEVSNNDYTTLDYIDAADIKGEGKKHLVLGLESKGKTPVLYGYSLENGRTEELFSKNYNIADLIEAPKTRSNSGKAQLAVWNRKEDDSYDIEMLQWNGTELEPVKTRTPDYYQRYVVPYYAQRVKRSPNSPSCWCDLADSLEKAGMSRDALIAAEIGINQDKNLLYREKLTQLKNRLAAQ